MLRRVPVQAGRCPADGNSGFPSHQQSTVSILESQRKQTLKSIIGYWASDQPWSAKAPNVCGQWLNTQMPLGPEHSTALKAFAIHAAAADPASGLARARVGVAGEDFRMFL